MRSQQNRRNVPVSHDGRVGAASGGPPIVKPFSVLILEGNVFPL